MLTKADAYERAKKIRLIILDVDGVLTDGSIYIAEDGERVKKFYCRDGLGINIAHRENLLTAIITGRDSKQVAYRAKELKIDSLFMGCMDKRDAYKELKEKYNLTDAEVAYVGDDLIDLPVMVQAGLPIAVADAAVEVKDRAVAISSYDGGRGAVRESIEFILKSQGKWENILAGFLSPINTKDLTQ